MLTNKNAKKFAHLQKGGHLLQRQIINPKNNTGNIMMPMDEGALPSMGGVQNLNQTNNISGGNQQYYRQDLPGLGNS